MSKPSRSSFWLALFALLISVIGTAISVIDTNILRDQQRMMAEEKAASVWPYVVASVVSEMKDNRAVVTYTLLNKGVGPALIGGYSFRIDGKPFDAAAVRDELSRRLPGTTIIPSKVRADTREVLAAGESFTPLELVVINTGAPAEETGELTQQPALQIASMLAGEFCYCSIYGDCWVINAATERSRGSCSGIDLLSQR